MKQQVIDPEITVENFYYVDEQKLGVLASREKHNGPRSVALLFYQKLKQKRVTELTEKEKSWLAYLQKEVSL